MKVVPVRPFSKRSRAVRKLYLASFPKEERLPFWFLMVKSWRRQAECLAYENEQTLIGFSYSISGQAGHFLLFLAVSRDQQSKGYGSSILASIKEKAERHPLILAIEPPHVEADNTEQRLRRLAFYEKNGLQLTPFFYKENKETYQLMTSHLPLDKTIFEKDLRTFFGQYVQTEVE